MKKYIHYCWFGDKPLPKLAKKCIESWKKYLPDYELKEWNESNSNVEECPFIKEAYENGLLWQIMSEQKPCMNMVESILILIWKL